MIRVLPASFRLHAYDQHLNMVLSEVEADGFESSIWQSMTDRIASAIWALFLRRKFLM
jgi:small nuclear ribonucleoprotein (snRNP)-like protein